MSELKTRDEILALVRSGKMSVSTAETWAAANGEIFSGKPDPGGFEPMAEVYWTLPMTAAWIVDRSRDAVREHWDRYRSEWHYWRRCTELSPDDEIVWGRELEWVGLARLADTFGGLDAFDGKDSRSSLRARPLPRASRNRLQQRRASRGPNLAQELAFALSSGQLGATGILRGLESRSPIKARHFLSDPFRYAEEKLQDAIYAVDLDDDIVAKIPYDEIRVSRDAVISLWPPLTPALAESPASAYVGIPSVKPAATLPKGFDRPDWSFEHVFAWLRHRDLAKLHALELADSERPNWYGMTYRGGFIDARSKNLLREALITESLVTDREETHVGKGARWDDQILLDVQTFWFRRDQIIRLWPSDAKTAHAGGRPPVVDWAVVETEVLRLMDYHGDFGADSSEWNAQARLEEAIEGFCDLKFKFRPGKTTINFDRRAEVKSVLAAAESFVAAVQSTRNFRG